MLVWYIVNVKITLLLGGIGQTGEPLSGSNYFNLYCDAVRPYGVK